MLPLRRSGSCSAPSYHSKTSCKNIPQTIPLSLPPPETDWNLISSSYPRDSLLSRGVGANPPVFFGNHNDPPSCPSLTRRKPSLIQTRHQSQTWSIQTFRWDQVLKPLITLGVLGRGLSEDFSNPWCSLDAPISGVLAIEFLESVGSKQSMSKVLRLK